MMVQKYKKIYRNQFFYDRPLFFPLLLDLGIKNNHDTFLRILQNGIRANQILYKKMLQQNT